MRGVDIRLNDGSLFSQRFGQCIDTGHSTCGIVAVSLAAGRPAKDTFREMRDRYNKSGRWRGTTISGQRLAYLKRYSVEYKKSTFGQGKTLRSWAEFYRPQGVRHHIVELAGHVVTVIGDFVIDQHGVCLMSDSRWKMKRVKSSLEIHNSPVVHLMT